MVPLPSAPAATAATATVIEEFLSVIVPLKQGVTSTTVLLLGSDSKGIYMAEFLKDSTESLAMDVCEYIELCCIGIPTTIWRTIYCLPDNSPSFIHPFPPPSPLFRLFHIRLGGSIGSHGHLLAL